jgi:hypothetical protein
LKNIDQLVHISPLKRVDVAVYRALAHFVVVLFCSLFAYLSESLGFQIFAFLIAYFSSWLVIEDAFSPVVFLGFFSMMYSISFPLLIYFGFGPTVLDELLSKIVLSGLAFYLGLCAVGWLMPFSPTPKGLIRSQESICRSSWVLFWVCAPFLLLLVTQIYNQGNIPKYEIQKSGFLVSMSYLSLAFAIMACRPSQNIERRVVFVGASFFIFYLTTGERDLFVRVVICFMLLFYNLGVIGRKHVMLLLLAAVVLEPISQVFKGVLTYANTADLNLFSSVLSVFSGEFMSSGRNFFWMLSRSTTFLTFYDGMLLNDVGRFLGLVSQSSTSQFGSQILEREGGSGVGFSLLGALFMLYGYIGPFIYGFATGLLLALLRAGIARLTLSVAAFLYGTVMFSLMYGFRADLANILSGVVKLGLIPVALLLFADYFIRRIRFHGVLRV